MVVSKVQFLGIVAAYLLFMSLFSWYLVWGSEIVLWLMEVTR